ncbi:MAG: signal recognition particle receptor subunit alpha, partial [Sediminibacterium sp.]
MSFLGKLFGKKEKESLDQGLQKTKEGFLAKITKAIAGKTSIDDEVLDNLEEALVGADVGIETTIQIIERIEKRAKTDKYLNTAELNRILQEEIKAVLVDAPEDAYKSFIAPAGKKPYIVLVVGVNGVGKTTTIGKLANMFMKNGKTVVIGAADTFRAAAVDQLKVWSERSGATFISHGMNTDPASVAFDAVKKAVEINADVVLIDTAGRLHNKINLMNELTKIKRVMSKGIDAAPHEVLLVIDG